MNKKYKFGFCLFFAAFLCCLQSAFAANNEAKFDVDVYDRQYGYTLRELFKEKEGSDEGTILIRDNKGKSVSQDSVLVAGTHNFIFFFTPANQALNPISVVKTIHVSRRVVESGKAWAVADIPEGGFFYDGKPKTPSVKVFTHIDERLVEVPASEYDVYYDNNLNATNNATVRVQGHNVGNYEFYYILSYTFSIQKVRIQVASASQTWYFDGWQHRNNTILPIKGQFPGNEGFASFEFYSEIGYLGSLDNGFHYKLRPGTSEENYDIVKVYGTLKVLPVETPIDDYKVSVSGPVYYDGTPQKPNVTITIGDVDIERSDFDVVYHNNVNAGTASLSIKRAPGGYFNLVPRDVEFQIEKAPISDVRVKVDSKEYDGTTGANFTLLSFKGAAVGDGPSVVDVQVSAEFEDAAAGKNKNVHLSYQLVGSGTSNYVLMQESDFTTADILGKVATLDWGETEFTYNGKAHTVTAKLGNILPGEVVAITGYTGNKATDVGLYTAAVTGLSSPNYMLPDNSSVQWQIKPREIGEVSVEFAELFSSFVFNAEPHTPAVVVKVGAEELDPADYVVEYTDNISVGTATVTVKPSSNGHVLFADASLPFKIDPLGVTINTYILRDKDYDGTTIADVSPFKYTDMVLYEGSDVKLVSQGFFTSANAGTDIPVAVTTSLVGSDAKNYYIKNPNIVLYANIRQKEVELVWTETTMQYDGTVKSVSATVNGAVGADVVKVTEYTGTTSASFVGRYTAVAASLNNDNYRLPEDASAKWEIINAKPSNYSLTLGVPTAGYVYDGTPKTPEATLVVDGVKLPKDHYRVTYYDNVNAGKAGIVINDLAGGIEDITPFDTFFYIAPASVSVEAAVASDKVYDGNTDAEVEITRFRGFVDGEFGDVVNFAVSGAFDDKNAGADKEVLASFQLVGPGAGNYSLFNSTAVVLARILPKEIHIIWPQKEFLFDGEEKQCLAVVPDPLQGDEVFVSSYGGVQAATAVGEYFVSAEALNNPNYMLPNLNLSTQWRIYDDGLAHYSIAVVAPEGGFIYNGKEQRPEVVVKMNSVVVPADEYNVEYFNNINAGSASIRVTDAMGGVYEVETVESSFNIQPAPIAVVAARAENKVYDGTNMATVTVPVFSGAVAGEDETVIKVVATGQFDSRGAGTGKIVSVLYALVGTGSSNYTLLTESGELLAAITPKPLDVTWTKSVFAYDGTPKSVSAIVRGAIPGDVVDVEEYGGVIFATEKGKYVASVVSLSNANYMVGENGTLKWVIADDVISGLVIVFDNSDEEYVYDGTEKRPQFNLMYGNTLIDPSEYEVSYLNNVNAGTATIVVKDAEDGAYTFDDVEADFVIKPRAVYCDWDYYLPCVLAYNGKEQQVEISLFICDFIDGRPKVSPLYEPDMVVYKGNKAKDLGKYRAEVVGLTNTNYFLSGPDPAIGNYPGLLPLDWEITSWPVPEYSINVKVESAKYTYDGTPHNPKVLAVVIGEDTLSASQYSISYANNVDAGTASLIIEDADSRDGYIFNPKTVYYDISPRQVKLNWDYDSFFFDGQEHSVSATVEGFIGDDVVEITGYKGNSATNVGNYLAKPVGLNNSNYMLPSASVEVTHPWYIYQSTISAEDVVVSVLDDDCVYNGEAQKPAVEVKVGDVVLPATEYTVQYFNNVYAGSGLVKITNMIGGNYVVPDVQAEFNIAPRTVELKWTKDAFVYDGLEKEVTATVANPVGYDRVTVTSYEDNQAVLAGSYTAKALALNDANYQLPEDAAKEWTISPLEVLSADIKVELLEDQFVYNGSEHEPSVTVSVGGLVLPISEYEVDYLDNVDAGTAMVVVTNAEGGNYMLNAASANFTIKPIEITFESATAGWEYDGLEHSAPAVTVTGEFAPGEGFTAQATGVITNVGAVTNTLVVEANEGTNPDNYSITVVEGVLSVSTLQLTPVVGDGLTIDPITGDTIPVTDPKQVYSLVRVNTDSLYYNRQPQTPDYAVYVNGMPIPATEYALAYTNNVNAGMASVTISNLPGNYSLAPSRQQFQINPLPVRVQSASETWNYDGLEHSSPIVNIISGYIAKGDTFDIKATGTITNVGVANNPVVITPVLGTLASNYRFTVTEGVLTVGSSILTPIVTNQAGETMTIDPVTGDTVAIVTPELTYKVERIDTDSLFYYGGEHTPSYMVYVNGEELVLSEYAISYINNVNAGTATVKVSNQEGGNYVLAPSHYFFEINPIRIALESATDSWVFDGEEHTNPEVAVKGDFVEGEGFNIVATGTITNVGSVVNGIFYTPENGTLSSNYSFTTTEGTLTVTSRTLTPVVINHAGQKMTIDPISGDTIEISDAKFTYAVERLNNDALVYNGEEQTPEYAVYVGGNKLAADEYAFSYLSNVNAGTGFIAIDNKDGGNYTLYPSQHGFIIDPVKITLETCSQVWVYDGLEHACTDVIVGGQFVKDEGFLYSTPASITEVGSADNILEVDAKEGTLLSNYAITKKEGTLVVTARELIPTVLDPLSGDTIAIDPESGDTIKSFNPADVYFIKLVADGELVYNGLPQTPAVELYVGKTKVDASQYLLTYKNNINAGTATFSVIDVPGGNYTFGFFLSDFTIVPAPVTIEACSQTWVYDGVEHSCNTYEVTGNVAEGDGFVVWANGSIIQVGSVANTLEVAANSKTLLANYAVTVVEGTLTVTPLEAEPVVNFPADDSIFYSGKAHEPAVEVVVGDVVIPESEYSVSYFNNVNAGEAGYIVSDVPGGNYVVDSFKGSFTIHPLPLTVKSGSQTWTYDGQKHYCDSVGINGFIVPGEGFTATTIGVITEVGTVENSVSVVPDGDTKPTNYSIVPIMGTLTVEALPLVPGFIDPLTGDTMMIDPISGDTLKADGSQSVGVWVVNPSGNKLVYNGKAHLPAVELYFNGELVPAEEYAVSYSNNINAGTAFVNVENKIGGNFVVTEAKLPFAIAPVEITVTSCSETWKFDGQRHSCPDVTVEGDFVTGESFDIKATGTISQVGSVANSLLIVPAKGTLPSNYSITTNVGTLTIDNRFLQPAFIDPVSGDTLTFDPLSGDTVKMESIDDVYLVEVDMSAAPFVYNGREHRPSVKVSVKGKELVLGEYLYSYADNVAAGTAHINIENVPNRYDMVYFQFPFTIHQREAKVNWTYDTTMFYNRRLQGVGHRVSGLVNGDAVNIVVENDSAINAGTYVAKVVDYDNKNYILTNDSLVWKIKVSQGAKPLLTPVAETEIYANDGRILGLTTDMEIKMPGEDEYKMVTDTAMLLAPGKYVVRLAETENHLASVDVNIEILAGLVPFKIDSFVVSPTGYCPGSEDEIAFNYTGKVAPASYRIVYSYNSGLAGFKFDSTEFVAIGKSGVIPIRVPNCGAGKFGAKIQFHSAKNYVSELIDVEIPVNLSPDYMTDIWDDVVSAVNTENRFVSYQWYHNDELLPGETRAYYCEKGGLSGSYFMEVVTVDNEKLRTCKRFFNNNSGIAHLVAYPNPVQSVVTVELTEDNGNEHQLRIFNSSGLEVFADRFKGIKTTVDMGSIPAGTYVIKVDKLDVKVIKK